jgi:hypothetical protein
MRVSVGLLSGNVGGGSNTLSAVVAGASAVHSAVARAPANRLQEWKPSHGVVCGIQQPYAGTGYCPV